MIEPPPAAPVTSRTDGLAVAHRLLLSVAVLAAVGTIVALVLVQRVGSTYQDGLAVAADGADVAAAAAQQASGVVDEVGALADAVSSGVEQAQVVLLASADSLEQIGVAMGDNISTGLEGTAEVADGLASFIEAIERFIPGDRASLAESLRKLADGLSPTPMQLRALALQLDATATDLRDAAQALGPINERVESLAASIGEGQTTVARLDELARRVQERSDAALDRSSTDLALLRVLVIVLGLGTAAAAIAGARAVRSLQRAETITAAGV